jgi:hypothetical protein
MVDSLIYVQFPAPRPIMENFFIKTILVFIAVFLADVLWVFYIRRTSQGRALSAAIFGTIIWLFGAFAVVSYIQDQRHIISAIIASFIGTYYAVKHDETRHKANKQKTDRI